MSMQVIRHLEVGAAGTNLLEFSAIPVDGTYTDLLLVASLRDTTGISSFMLQATTGYFNSSSANFTYLTIDARDIGALTGSGSNSRWGYHEAPPAPSDTFSSLQMYIPNFASSNYKNYSLEYAIPSTTSGGDNSYRGMYGGIWSQNAAISNLRLGTSGSFVQHSSATLYGIKAGSDGVTTVS